jgi:site-specific DNA-methyltransferase (cytosine-N4-specific)
METRHEVRIADARSLAVDDPVDLVVTSPPYPMIEMWDDAFAAQDPRIGDALDAGAGDRAFRLMHELLDDVWARVADSVRQGGIVCVNVGDATRNLDGFQQYPNAAEITVRLREHGLQPLPDILWRKPTNSANKFMGSGMLPTNAYPTLEHEHVLIFRRGGTRSFPPGDDRRYESAYFWEERNRWFTDSWELRGRDQSLENPARERSGAFPLALPYRLICMFSVYGDTVLDPFWGTGTTSLAALAAGRNSLGYERDAELVDGFADLVADAPAVSRELAEERLAAHREFADGRDTEYEAEHYDVGVTTTQERRIRLYAASSVEAVETGEEVRAWVGHHEPV